MLTNIFGRTRNTPKVNRADKIKQDLEKRFPRARFSVRVSGDDVSVDHIGGHDYADEFSTHRGVVREMTRIIRKTIPNLEWMDYTVNGKVFMNTLYSQGDDK